MSLFHHSQSSSLQVDILTLIQECEASPHCRRLQLKDLLVSEMQRLTKYPLLLDNILKHTDGESVQRFIVSTQENLTYDFVVFKTEILVFPSASSADLPSLQRAQACCRGILQAVNEVVRETEHRQRLSQYQRRLDAAPQFKVIKSLFFLSVPYRNEGCQLCLTLSLFSFSESGPEHEENDP